MALRQVALSATDAGGTANTAAIKAALSALGADEEGIQLPAGTYNVYATSGSVAPLPAGKAIAGATVAVGTRPLTNLRLVGSDSTSANVVAMAASGIATGVAVRDLEIDGGRMGGWATASYTGACVSIAGQNDYSGTPHNAQIINCWLSNGLTQQASINSVHGLVVDRVTTWADAGPTQAAHGFDFDAVANSKRTKFVTMTDCDLNSYGQESMKLENTTDFTATRTVFRQYLSLTQDVSPYDELGRITFDACTFDAHVSLSNLKLTLGGGTGGDGSVTWKRCTFTENGMIYSNDATVANYGTMTVQDCVFSPAGNSFKFPVGVTVTKSGNLFAEMPTKRFARPAADPTLGSIFDPGTSPNAYMARRTTTTSINTAVTASANGEEVWALNGIYVGQAGGANRSISCGGKTITLRAESRFGVLLDESAASGYAGFSQSADVAGHLIWGFVVYGAGIPGGNGAGATITGGDSYMRSMAVLNCKSANNGPGLRITTTGTVLVEDFLVANCDAGATQAAVYVSQAAPVGTITLKRGRVLNNVATGTVAGARLDNANTTVEGLEVAGNTNSASTGGLLITKNATVTNLTCGGNSGAANAHDVNITSGTTTADSWVCWSDNGGSIKAVNVVTATLTLDKATLFGGSGNVTGAGTKNLTNILSTDPQFVDATGGNYQLKAASPSRGVGVQRAGLYDAFNKPFAYDAATANHGAWA